MNTYPIYQVDAFTNQVFSGNPAAVVPLPNWLPDEQMQAIGLENNLSETAFFIPLGDQYGIRWFTPTVEVDLCGHATLATAHVLFQHLGHDKDTIEFQSKSGLLTVQRKADRYVLNFPTDNLKPVVSAAAISEALNGLYIRQLFEGRNDYLAAIDSETALVNLSVNLEALKKVPSRGLIVTAKGVEVDFVARCFFPNAGIDEDPVTGSAYTTLMPYWSSITGKNKLSARQLSARGGELECELLGDRVNIAGKAVTYLKGEIYV